MRTVPYGGYLMRSTTAITQRARYYRLQGSSGGSSSLIERSRRRSGKDMLIVFDPGLIGFAGHHLELARLIKAELSAEFDVRFYANFEAANRIITELPAQPACSGSLYVHSKDFRVANEEQRASLTLSLRKIDLRQLTPKTTFVMHTVTVYQLTGLADWFTALPPAHRPKLFLQFQFPLEFGVEREIRLARCGTSRS